MYRLPLYLHICILTIFFLTPLADIDVCAEEIADGVECYSTKLDSNNQAIFPAKNCSDSSSTVHILIVDLSKAKVEPIMTDLYGYSGDDMLYSRKNVKELSATRRSAAPVNAVAAVNGGFFTFNNPAFNLSKVVDYRHTWPSSESVLEGDQQCRMNKRYKLRLRTPSGTNTQVPEIVARNSSDTSGADLRVLGGGGQLLPVLSSDAGVPACSCAGLPTPGTSSCPHDHTKCCDSIGRQVRCCDSSGQPDPSWNISRPRTAVGYRFDESPHKLRIVTVGGEGVTISELKSLMTQLFGVTNAMALDGGGSTQFWAKTSSNEIFTWGSSPSARKVVSALVVYGKPVAPFRITDVLHPSVITMGGDKGDLAVHWSGNPVFPVTMTYFNKGLCPSPYNCVNPTKQFNVSTNPFYFPGALWCGDISKGGDYFFDYGVVLEDAAGNRTQEQPATFTCRGRMLPAACNDIIGRWRWFTGRSVDFFANNRWKTLDGRDGGTWQCNPDGSIVVTPDRGTWQDTVTIAGDGNSLSGKNQNGVSVSATRHQGMLYDLEQGPYGGGRFCLTEEEATRIKNDPNTVKITPVGIPCSK